MEDLGIMEAEAEVDIMVEAVVMEEEEVDSLSRINTKVHTRINVITAVDTRIRFSSRAIFSVGIARSLGTWRVSAAPNKRMSRNLNLQDVEEESMLFMTRSTCTSASDVVWFLIAVVPITWQEQSRYSMRLMGQRRVKLGLEMTRH